jgi:hypothetical protein
MDLVINRQIKEAEEVHGLIYIGKDDTQLANELEKDAREMGIKVTDTLLKIDNGPQILRWYMKNSSITTILIRRMSDLSVESEVQNDILVEAKRNGISINVKEMGWKAVESVPWDGSAGC